MSQQDGRPPGGPGSSRVPVPNLADLQRTATGVPTLSRELDEAELPKINAEGATRITGEQPAQGETVMVPQPVTQPPARAPSYVPGQAPLPQITLSTVNVKAHLPVPKPPPGPQISAAPAQQVPRAPTSLPGGPGSAPARPLPPGLAKTVQSPLRAAGVAPLPPLAPRPPPAPLPAPAVPRAPTGAGSPPPAKMPAHLLPTDPLRAAPNVAQYQPPPRAPVAEREPLASPLPPTAPSRAALATTLPPNAMPRPPSAAPLPRAAVPPAPAAPPPRAAVPPALTRSPATQPLPTLRPPPAESPPATLPPSPRPVIQAPELRGSPFGFATGPPEEDERTIAVRHPGPPAASETVATSRPAPVPSETVNVPRPQLAPASIPNLETVASRPPPAAARPAPIAAPPPAPAPARPAPIAAPPPAPVPARPAPIAAPPRMGTAPPRPLASTMPAGPRVLGPEFAVTQPGTPGPAALQALRRAAAEEATRAPPPAVDDQPITQTPQPPPDEESFVPDPTRELPIPQRAHQQWAEPSAENNLAGIFDDVSGEQPMLESASAGPQFANELLDDAPPVGDGFAAEGDDGPHPDDAPPPATDEDVEAGPTRNVRRDAIDPGDTSPPHAADTQPPQKLGEVPAAEVIARPASMWRQLLAWTIDVSFWAAMSSGYFYLQRQKHHAIAISGVDTGLAWVKSLGKVGVTGVLIAIGIALLYTLVFTSLLKGRTPGRLFAGLRLVTKKGETPGLLRALLRTGFAALSFVTCLAGFWLALFDRRAQTLHDKLTGTFVVRLDS